MIASSVLVLGSLTATGLWLRRDSSRQDEGYVVDLSAIENNTAAGFAQESDTQSAKNIAGEATLADDLDYDPYFQETNSQKVENPDQSESESMSEGADQARDNENESNEEEESKQTASPSPKGEEIKEDEEGTPALSTAMQPALTFSDSDTLVLLCGRKYPGQLQHGQDGIFFYAAAVQI